VPQKKISLDSLVSYATLGAMVKKDMKLSILLFASLGLLVNSSNALSYTTGYSSYQIIEGNYTWEEARLDAISRGGHLVTLTSEAEDNAVANSGLYENFINNGGNLVWLGAESDGSANWSWVTGEEISSYTYDNWYMGLTTSAYYHGNAGWSAYFIHGSGGTEWYPINKDYQTEGSYMLETVVPESSTYALLLSTAVLGYVFLQRRE
jgi:hypothetical protein